MKYKTVPKIITGKDLDYLNDAFKWNMEMNKTIDFYLKFVKDSFIKKHLNNLKKLTLQNAKSIVCIVKEGNNES